MRMGADGGPNIVAKDWKAIAADSRSYPDFLFVANAWRVDKTPLVLEEWISEADLGDARNTHSKVCNPDFETSRASLSAVAFASGS